MPEMFEQHSAGPRQTVHRTLRYGQGPTPPCRAETQRRPDRRPSLPLSGAAPTSPTQRALGREIQRTSRRTSTPAPYLGGTPVSPARSTFSQLALADTPNAVSWARRHTVDILSRSQVQPDLVETARLLVSELTTNAIRHAEPAEDPSPHSPLAKVGTVGLLLWLDMPRLVLQVRDHDPRPPVVKSVGEDAETGRGLFLVDCMSARWGFYYPTPGVKAVWAELSLVPGTGHHPPAGTREDHVPPLTVARALVGLRAT